MDVYKTEEEQIEAIKKWWAENGKAVAFGVAVGLIAVFGWRGWQSHIVKQTGAASGLYQQLMVSIREGKDDEGRTRAEKVVNEYGDTTYAVLARMMLAKYAVADKDLDKAADYLRAAMKKSGQESLQLEIRLRLAEVLKEKQDYDQALKLLDIQQRGAFDDRYEELKGDIFVAKGDTTRAVDAYREAMIKARAASRDVSLLEMKMDDLGQNVQ